MGSLRTILAAAITVLFAAPMSPPAFAQGESAVVRNLPKEFAYCAGRLSALMEHQWLLSDPAADRTHAQRAAMISLLESVTPTGQARHLLYLRISAKVAQAELLTIATFDKDPERKSLALMHAETEIGACLNMLLG